MMYIAGKAFFFKSSTFRLQFFLPCLCIREGVQKLSHKAWLKADLFCQGYSKFSLLAIYWGGVLSQASCCASAHFQLLGSLAGKRVEELGVLCAATWIYCKSQPLFAKPSVSWTSSWWSSVPTCCGFELNYGRWDFSAALPLLEMPCLCHTCACHSYII